MTENGNLAEVMALSNGGFGGNMGMFWMLILFLFILSVSAGSLFSLNTLAAPSGFVYTNPDTGYSVYIKDDQNLITETQENALIEDMKPITEYGNAGFISCIDISGSIESYSRNIYRKVFREENGSLFVIDMGNRELYIKNNGKISEVVTNAYSLTISDNIYRYASKGLYYTCASTAYKQAYTLLQGGRIAQPMRYISAALVALIIALTLNYLILRFAASASKANAQEIIDAAKVDYRLRGAEAVHDHTSRVYSPVSRSSGGGGGSRGGGGGFSGGSGGGHGF